MTDTLEAVRRETAGYSAEHILRVLDSDTPPLGSWAEIAHAISLHAALLTRDAEHLSLDTRALKAHIIAGDANVSASAAETLAGREPEYIEAKRALADARFEARVAGILASALAARAGITLNAETDG